MITVTVTKRCQIFLALCTNVSSTTAESRAKELRQFFGDTHNTAVEEALRDSDWLRFLSEIIPEIKNVEEYWYHHLFQFEESQKRQHLLKVTFTEGVLRTATAWCGFMQVVYDTKMHDHSEMLQIATRYGFQVVNDAAHFLTDIWDEQEEGEEEELHESTVQCVGFIYTMLGRFKAFYDKNLDKIETPFDLKNLDRQWFGFWSEKMQDEISHSNKRKRDSSPEGRSVSNKN
jgi:hypothetical protein